MGSPPTPRTSPPLVWLTSPPRSSSSTTPDRCQTATAPSLIATPLTLLASLPRSRRRLTVVPVSPPRTTPSSSSLGQLPTHGQTTQLDNCILASNIIQPWLAKLWHVQLFVELPKICLYFHRKEFRRIFHLHPSTIIDCCP